MPRGRESTNKTPAAPRNTPSSPNHPLGYLAWLCSNMPGAQTAALAEAVRVCRPGDADGMDRLRQALAAAVEAAGNTDDPSEAEAVLSCVLESFGAAADDGKVVLDDMLLEMLPPLAGLADHSADCSRLLTAFCSLAAAACSPRDLITACLEVLSNLVDASSLGPDGLQFACNLLLMLPEQVAKLSRRKAANAAECCLAAAALAQVHGQVLAGWSINQLGQAAQQAAAHGSAGQPPAAAATLQRLDTFLAANWQAYVEFAEGMVQQVLQKETEPEACETARTSIRSLVLQLLQHLTAVWPPPALHALALQVLKDPGAAQLLPSTESVAPPAAMLSSAGRHQQGPAGSDSNAEVAVADLVHVLQACDTSTWQQLSTHKGTSAAGAGLAALTSRCAIEPPGGTDTLLAMPDTAAQTIQLACRWCCAMVDASDNNILAILKAIALLQLAAAHARQLQADTATVTQRAQLPKAGSLSTDQLVADLQPCVALLAGVISQAPVHALRAQASVALQQVLQALPHSISHACLQQMLTGEGAGGALHPEVAALLMQEVRGLLANSAAGACFNPSSCLQLVLPWLLQQGPVGWQTADTLADKANAVNAALAVVRLGLLREQAAAASGDTLGASSKQQLQSTLSLLSAAVSDALPALQAVNRFEQAAAAAGATAQDSAADGRVRVPGEAQGSGQAVDAWLAVSRVQDVLDRVLELLQ